MKRRSSRRGVMTIVKTTATRFGRCLLASACLALPVLASAQTAPTAQKNPGEIIEIVVRQTLKELDAHRAEMRGDPRKIRKLVDELMLPHFDTEYSARQV